MKRNHFVYFIDLINVTPVMKTDLATRASNMPTNPGKDDESKPCHSRTNNI